MHEEILISEKAQERVFHEHITSLEDFIIKIIEKHELYQNFCDSLRNARKVNELRSVGLRPQTVSRNKNKNNDDESLEISQ